MAEVTKTRNSVPRIQSILLDDSKTDSGQLTPYGNVPEAEKKPSKPIAEKHKTKTHTQSAVCHN